MGLGWGAGLGLGWDTGLALGERVGRDRLEHELATLGQLDVVQRGGREARLSDGQLGVAVDDGRLDE